MRSRRSTPQAAAIPILDDRICLVTSRRTGGWVIPKGGLEAGKSVEEMALQEAWEEAGLIGHLWPHPIGAYEYEKSGGLYRPTVFVMQVTELREEWPEQSQRQRRLCRPADAVALIAHPGLRELMIDFVAQLRFESPLAPALAHR